MRGRILLSLLDPITLGKAVYLLVLKCRHCGTREWLDTTKFNVQHIIYEKWCVHTSTNGLPQFTLDDRAQRDKRSSNDEKFQKSTEWHMLNR